MNNQPIYESVNILTLTMMQLKESLKERDSLMSKNLTPLDFKEIMSTMAKLRSALVDTNMSNAQLLARNNALNLELSFMPRKMREHLEQVERSHSRVVANQRTDPHHLIPNGTKYVFQRADTNDPIVSKLQRCSHYSSVNHLLNEVDDIVDVLKTLDPDQVDDEQDLDMEDGFETQGVSSTKPPKNTNHVGEQKGLNKRVHEKIVALGHKVHPSQSQEIPLIGIPT
jgi:hypothetical protein